MPDDQFHRIDILMDDRADLSEPLIRIKSERKSFQPADDLRSDFIHEIETCEMFLHIGAYVARAFYQKTQAEQQSVSQ